MSCPVECPKPHSAPSADAAALPLPIVNGVSACGSSQHTGQHTAGDGVFYTGCAAIAMRRDLGRCALRRPNTHRKVVWATEGVQEASS
jgi:hypothetical protein